MHLCLFPRSGVLRSTNLKVVSCTGSKTVCRTIHRAQTSKWAFTTTLKWLCHLDQHFPDTIFVVYAALLNGLLEISPAGNSGRFPPEESQFPQIRSAQLTNQPHGRNTLTFRSSCCHWIFNMRSPIAHVASVFPLTFRTGY